MPGAFKDVVLQGIVMIRLTKQYRRVAKTTMPNQDWTPRHSTIQRDTKETHITVTLGLDGTGIYDHQTGVGFLDHMLDLFARHGRFDLTVKADGDLHIDDHHTVEDVGICLGQAFATALADKAYIERYGHAYVPMDEALVRSVVDLSGRMHCTVNATFSRPMVGDLSTELVSHFWESFAQHAACNLHIDVIRGTNAHHMIEGIFKATARALSIAVSRSASNGTVLSTKGSL